MQKNYRFSKYSFDYSRGTDSKVQLDSNKKHPRGY